MVRSKLIIIELDGASWDVINPLISTGRLPNISSLITRGVSRTLISDPPLLSPRLWVSIFSGKKSSEHGVEFFGSSASMVKCKRIWDILSDKGETVGVFGSFVTWPPYPVNGFMIPSLFSVGPETYPPQYRFLQELTLGERRKNSPERQSSGLNGSHFFQLANYAYQLKRHGVGVRTFIAGLLFYLANFIKHSPQDEKYWKKGVLHLRICTDLFSRLYRLYKPVFSTFHIHISDAFSHRYWKYYEPDKFSNVEAEDIKRYSDVIPNAYIEADRTIGRFVSQAGPDTTIAILSDHGSKALEAVRESFRLKPEAFLEFLGIEKKVIPANIGFMTFLYFNDRELMARVPRSIEEIRFADNGQKVFDVIYEESLMGIRLTDELWTTSIDPGRVVDAGDYGQIPFSQLFSEHKADVSGDHDLEGVLIVAGPGIKEGASLPDASIYDITPTSLALMGRPVGRDMHGKVLVDMFDPPLNVSYIDSYDSSEPQEQIDESIEIEKVKSRLKALGYL